MQELGDKRWRHKSRRSGASEGNTRDSHGRSRVGGTMSEHPMQENSTPEIAIEAMAYQDLAVQLERNLWQ